MLAHSTGKPTKAEAARMDAIKELGCMIARMRGLGWTPCEVHHLIRAGKRIGHMATVGLNPWSHRGVPFNGMTVAQCKDLFGASLAKGSRPFHAEHGSDSELLAAQDAMLDRYASCRSC